MILLERSCREIERKWFLAQREGELTEDEIERKKTEEDSTNFSSYSILPSQRGQPN